MANREVHYAQTSQYKDARQTSYGSDDESISEAGSTSNGYDPEWLEEVSESGDLFYIGASLPISEEHSTCEGDAEYSVPGVDANSANNINNNNGLQGSQKTKTKGKGKLKALIKNNKLRNGDLGPREVPGAEDVGSMQMPKVTFQDPRGEIKEVHLDIDPNRHNYGRRASPCEVLFGIIPGRFHSSRSGGRTGASSGANEDARIMIQGLLPDGEAIRCQSIKIGDCLQRVNGVDVTYFNINQVLSTITYPTKVTLTLQGFAGHVSNEDSRVTVQPVHKTKLAKLVSRIGHQQDDEEVVPASDVPYVVLYLTVEGVSEFSAGKQDVVYQYPEADNKLVQVRGMFITIAHMLPDVTSSYPLSSSLTVDNKLIHVGYAVEGNEVLIIGIPDECITLSRLHQLMKDMVRLLRLQYHTLHQAFTQPANKIALDHMFALSFQWLLSNKNKPLASLGSTGELMFKDCVPAAEWLSLPSHVQLEVDNVLSEFEAAEFVDMSEDYYDARRSYNILGACIFYKGYLMGSHLSKEDLLDVFLYLKHYGLLTLTCAEPISQIVVWKEVFPSQHPAAGNDNSANAEMAETEGRYFLLVVGSKQQLMGILLEAGGCSSRAQGHPSPEPFYIDQALATLMQLESSHIPAACDNWLNCASIPVANVEWFIHSGKGNKDEMSFRTRDPSPSASGVKAVPQNVRKSQNELTSILKKKTNTSQQFTGSNTALCDNESDTSHSMATSATSSMSDETTPVMARRNPWSQGRTSGSDADSRASSDGALYRSAKTNRILPGNSSLDLSSLYKNLPDGDAAAVQLTTGCENVLFHYLQLDTSEGVIISPRQHESGSMLSTEVLDNFQASCLMIRQVFHNTLQYKELMKNKEVPRLGIAHSLGAVKEHGVLFQCSLPARPNQKKPSPTVTYWVVGRLFSGLNPREVYVCFLDSIPQNVIEIAFRLGFGVTT